MVAGLVMLGFGVALALPPEGLYFGSASYGGKGNPTQLVPCYTGHAHSRWTGARPTPSEQIRITKEEGYGNCQQKIFRHVSSLSYFVVNGIGLHGNRIVIIMLSCESALYLYHLAAYFVA